MKTRFLMAALIAVVAATGFALSPDHSEFGKGPATFLMTKEEAAQWKQIPTDEEAAKFIALFWARRDPTPGTPRNELREEFDARVKFSDDNFTVGKMKGSMSDRGKTIILFGGPKHIQRSTLNRGPAAGTVTDQAAGIQTFVYEGESATLNFNAARATIRFEDERGRGEYILQRGGAIDYAGAQARAIARFITQPNLTEAPRFGAPAQQTFVDIAPAAAAPAPAPVLTDLTTEAFKSAVAEYKKAGKSQFDKPVYATTGEFVTSDGVTFTPVLVYVPKGSAPASVSTFFAVVEDASGKSVLAFEEPAKLNPTKYDFFVDKTLMLPAGKYRGFFGLADNGKPVALVSADMELAGKLDKDAPAASMILISNNVFPLPEAQAPTDPFAFGGLKVVPKADKVFRTSDELWYFVELRNPGMAGEGEAAKPNVQVKMDVEGTETGGKKVKMSAPPTEVDALVLKGVPNHYGIGSSIPLASFKPGDYTFNVKIIDTVKKASYTLSEKFKVVE